MQHFYNPDEFIQSVSGWNQEYHILSNKGFEAQAQQVEIEGIVMVRAKIKGDFLQQGSVDKNRFAFGIPCPEPNDVSFRGRPISQTSMKCLKDGMETGLVSKSFIDLIAINAPIESLQNYLGEEVSDDFHFLYQNALKKKFLALSAIMANLASDNAEEKPADLVFDTLLDDTNPSCQPVFEILSIKNFEKAKRNLTEAFSSSVGVLDASKYMGMSPYLLNKYCKSLYGHNYTRSRTIFNLNKARKMLYFYRNEQSISDISYECGFNSPSHFAKEFKKLFGIPPRDYISQVR